MRRSLAIEVWFDLICPWCLIGRRHLLNATGRFSSLRPDVAVSVDWRPVPLLPDTPREGLPYQSFYERRLGGPAAVAARRAQVRVAARAADLEIAFDRIEVLPNTLAAHRLLECARRHGGPARQLALLDALFAGYFLQGENIGDRSVLERIAEARGLDAKALSEWRDAREEAPRTAPAGVPGVPFYVFNDRLTLSGAHPPQVLVEAMERAVAARPVKSSPMPPGHPRGVMPHPTGEY
jgi:predicted DsbA family dithiol-disulfide isomerase